MPPLPPDEVFAPDASGATATLPQPQPADSLALGPRLWAVVFAGGIGSRFWPLSTPERPKPVLELLGARPLIANTVERLAPLIPPERILVATSADIADAVHRAIPEVPLGNVLVEPRPLGTAAAFAWALAVIATRGGPDALACAMHADLAAAFPGQLRDTIDEAARLAAAHRMPVALGVTPTRAERAFGYLVPGAPLRSEMPVARGGAARVAAFVEKPSVNRAASLVADGALWHAGIVLAPVQPTLDLVFSVVPELAGARGALAIGDTRALADAATGASLERAILERAPNVMMLPLECGWDDVGTWACLRRARDLDDSGNGGIGDTIFVDSESNVVHGESGTVVLFGCERMLVVALPGLTFVTPLDRAGDLKPLLEQLPPSLRSRPTRSPS